MIAVRYLLDDKDIEKVIPIILDYYDEYNYVDVRSIIQDSCGYRIKIGAVLHFTNFKEGDLLKVRIDGIRAILRKGESVLLYGKYKYRGYTLKISKSGRFKILKVTQLVEFWGLEKGDILIIMAKRDELCLIPFNYAVIFYPKLGNKVEKIIRRKFKVEREVIKDGIKTLFVRYGKELIPIKISGGEIDVRDIDKIKYLIFSNTENI